MKILAWQLIRKNTMRGVVDVELVSPNGPWVALPAKVQIDRDGIVRRNLATGKPEYARVLKWRDSATRDKFSAAVIKLLLERHPRALDAEDAA
jgi:hypothetical protein